MTKSRGTGFAALLLAGGLIPPAFAQTTTPSAPEQSTQTTASSNVHGNVLQEVVITAARKRQENVQTTPIAVTAVSANILERAHVSDLTEMGHLAPNLYLAPQKTQGDGVTVYLRGFGIYSSDPAVDPHVALFLDGIYQPSAVGNLLDLFDVQQVEVLAGPQGVLVGKNAPVGAITVTSDKPTGDFSGEIEGDYGSYDHFGARAKVNFPIIRDSTGNSILSGKVSFVEKEGGNWIKNTLTHDPNAEGGENTKAGRFNLAFTPTDEFRWDLAVSAALDRDPQQGIRDKGSQPAFPGTTSSASQGATLICNVIIKCAPTEYGTTNSAFSTRNRSDTVEVASNMSYRFDTVTLTSITGFLSYWGVLNTDDSGLPIPGLWAYDDRTRYDQESEEFRVTSNKNGGWDLGGHLDWLLGGYFSNFQYSANNHIDILSAPGVPNINQFEDGTTQSEAAFAQAIYHFTDQWSGTFGVRQSWDQKDHDYVPNGSTLKFYDTPIGFHNTSFEAGTSYQFDPDRMAYFRFAQGYASGGYLGYPGAGVGSNYKEETVNSYEVGLKSDWLNKRLRVNVDLFTSQVSDLQIEGTIPLSKPPFFVQATTNAATATVEGLESQIVAVPITDLTVHLNLGYLHPTYGQYHGTACSNVSGVPADCSGNPFPFAPKWTINLGEDYVMDLPNGWGSATFSADWDYRSTIYSSDPPYPGSRQEGYGLINLGLKFLDPSEKYSLEFYGTNVLNRHYSFAFGNLGGLFDAEMDGAPAEWGLRVIVKFGPFS